MRNVFLALLIVCLFAMPAMAINGQVAFDYDLNGGAHDVELFLFENLDENLLVGGKVLGEMGELDFALPTIKGYELLVELKLDENLSVGATVGNEDIMDFADFQFDYAKINFKYKF